MTVVFTASAWDELASWIRDDPEQVRKIAALIRDIRRTPFEGLGKPEPLRHDLAGYGSRRIDPEHRLVYAVEGEPSKVTRLPSCSAGSTTALRTQSDRASRPPKRRN